MNITGALAFWNELPGDLDRCIRGLANIADRVVAVDGAYRRYPTGTARSADDQVDAIRSAARATGMKCLIVQPEEMWAGQVEKRTFLLGVAAIDSDLIVVVDTDHIITTNRDAVRAHLERANGVTVWSVPLWTPPNPDKGPKDRAAGLWHENQAGQTYHIPHIYRALPGLRVEKRHWWYSALLNGQRHWLWGGDPSYPAVPVTPIPVPYQVEHRCLYRTAEQVRISRGFLNDREMVMARTGQEDDVPGLPEPVYDYERMPE